MTRKAIVLGTGNAQVDIIRNLKEIGWFVIGCSYCREGRGVDFVDQFELIDIKDSVSLEELARRERVDFVYSVGSDLAVPVVAKVSSRLGLPSFVKTETAELTQNKHTLKEFLTENALNNIKYKKVTKKADLEGWDHFPAIVKPVDSQGQRGIFVANSIREIAEHLEYSFGFSRCHSVIVEEFLYGPEVSVNVFVVDSRVVFRGISDRLTVEGYPGGIPRGHIFPAKSCIAEGRDEIQALVDRSLEALGIKNGPVYFQIKLTAGGPKIVEIAPRLDGCHLWRLIKTVCGVDLLKASIHLLAGENSLNFKGNSLGRSAHLSFFLSPPGRTFHRENYPTPSEASHVEYYCKNGETVGGINGFLEKVGYWIVS